MDNWSAREDDIPYHLRSEVEPPRRAVPTWLVFVLGIVVVLAAGGYAYYSYLTAGRELPDPYASTPRAEAPAGPNVVQAPTPAAEEEEVVRHLLATEPAEQAKTLPDLDQSDPVMRADGANLLGRKAFAELVYPEQLIRRIVATVDNLPRRTSPARMMPVQPLAGGFIAGGTGDELVIGPKNAARYGTFVKTLTAMHSPTFVRLYVERYPLFQRAYEELGYPGKYFNDRLIEAIEDMLAAPEVRGPVALVQPKTLYQFADPALENLSAGQKIMIRMGPDNAAKMKAKLREIRAELAKVEARS
jgi:flagellar basal body-associated protein FliL